MQLSKVAARAAFTIAVLTAALAAADATTSKVRVDPAIAPYAKSAEKIEGSLNSIGSDTMNNLMTYWGEGFNRLYPGVKPQVEGKGSSTAPPALIEGTSQLGPMSRDMKADEIDKFEQKYGYKPTRLRTSLDSLAVFVHHDNPLKSLSLAQIDSIFSSTRKRGGQEINTWGDLGLTGEWASKPINLYGRNSASGTYGFFKEHALKKGDYRNSVKEQPGSASVVQGVSEDLYAIGYSGVGYATSGVRAVPLSEKDGKTAFEATFENSTSGDYPLARFLVLYINKAPGQPLSPLVREFCRYVFSKEGQEVVIKDGYYPVDAKTAAKELRLLD